jgi:hypothetical protein
MTTKRACTTWHSSLFDHCRSAPTDNSPRPPPLAPADGNRDLRPHALIEWSLPDRARCAWLDDRRRPTVYLASTEPKPRDLIDLPLRQALAKRTVPPETPRRPGVPWFRLAGFQHDLFRPFARRLDPDDRSIDDELFREHRRRRWQTPVGDQQQRRKRGSDEVKVTGYGQCLWLQGIEQWRLVHNRDIRHGLAHCIQTML